MGMIGNEGVECHMPTKESDSEHMVQRIGTVVQVKILSLICLRVLYCPYP